MDNDQQVQVIEARLDVLDGMPVSDDRSAREALTHVMVTVSRISQLSAQVRGQALMGAGAPADDIHERLRTWLDRLISALTRSSRTFPVPGRSRSRQALTCRSPWTSGGPEAAERRRSRFLVGSSARLVGGQHLL